MPNENWLSQATRLVTAPRPQSEAEVRERGEAALRLVHEALIEEANGRLARQNPDEDAVAFLSGSGLPVTLPHLLQGGSTVVLEFVHGQSGVGDENGEALHEPVDEGYHAVLHLASGRQIGEGMGATVAEALAAIRIPDESEYSSEPPFDLAAQPLSDPGEYPAV